MDVEQVEELVEALRELVTIVEGCPVSDKFEELGYLDQPRAVIAKTEAWMNQ